MDGNDREVPIDLRGQVALVTGAGQGIGRAVARALAAAGAAVGVNDVTADRASETAQLIETAGGRGLPLTGDVSDRNAVDDMVQRVERELGALDLLVNNAGIAGTFGPLAENDPDDWWRAMEVNLRGPLLCSRAALTGMLARQRGRIVNMASNAGVMPAAGSSVGAGAYMVSKTALIRLTEVLAADTRDCGISVFAISPSAVRTGLTEAIVTSPIAAARAPEFVRRWIKIFSEGQDVPPERAAQLVVALASGQADALSGCFIRVTDNLEELVRSVRGVDGDHFHKLRLRT